MDLEVLIILDHVFIFFMENDFSNPPIPLKYGKFLTDAFTYIRNFI